MSRANWGVDDKTYEWFVGQAQTLGWGPGTLFDRLVRRWIKDGLVVQVSYTGDALLTHPRRSYDAWLSTLTNNPQPEIKVEDSPQAGDQSGLGLVLHESEPSYKKKKSTYPSGKSTYTKIFEEWWEVYPKKKGKGAAAKAHAAARKKVSPRVLQDACLAFRALWDTKLSAGDDLQFCPNAATWLNQERWSDDLEQDRPKSHDSAASWQRARDRSDRERAEREAHRRKVAAERGVDVQTLMPGAQARQGPSEAPGSTEGSTRPVGQNVAEVLRTAGIDPSSRTVEGQAPF